MKTRLLSRLDRAITCVNAYDSDFAFNRQLMEVRQYARFISEGDEDLEKIVRIVNDAISKTRLSREEKERIKEELRSIQKKIGEELHSCLSSM